LTRSRLFAAAAFLSLLVAGFCFFGYTMEGSFMVVAGEKRPYMVAATVWGALTIVSLLSASIFAFFSWRQRQRQSKRTASKP
jgi:hypothetical protein